MKLDFIFYFFRFCLKILLPFIIITQFTTIFSFKISEKYSHFVSSPISDVKIYRIYPLQMVSSRKVQSFTNRSRTSKSKVSQTVSKSVLTKKSVNKTRRSRDRQTVLGGKKEKNYLLDKFGVDLGSFGQSLYDWLWPNNEPSSEDERKSIESMTIENRFLQSRLISFGEKPGNPNDYNNFLHSYINHNYASERFVDIFKRLSFQMRLSPRILFREIGAITGKFGINILYPNENEKGRDINPYILSLRRIKFEVYSLLGFKLLRYTMLFLLRYIRLGIPNEIKLRFLTDLLKQDYMSKACGMACNQIEFGDNKNDPLRQTYPIRNSFETQGYPYSDEPFYIEGDEANTWSPSNLVSPEVFRFLSNKNKSKLLSVAASLHPDYALQIVKNVAFAAGYKSERDLLTNFCMNSTFTSRGSRSFLRKLRHERLSDERIRMAAKLYKKGEMPTSLKSALDILLQAPFVSGLIRRHLESGHKVIPLRRARMILKLVRSEVDLLPEEMELWDVLKNLINRRVLNAPPKIYKQVAKQILALKNFSHPDLGNQIESRGIDTSDLYKGTQGIPDNFESLPYNDRVEFARKIRKNVMDIWLHNESHSFQDTGIYLIDSLSSVAGYKNLNNVLTIVSMLSKPQTKVEKCSTQPGPDFEHSPKLEFKDFKNKVM